MSDLDRPREAQTLAAINDDERGLRWSEPAGASFPTPADGPAVGMPAPSHAGSVVQSAESAEEFPQLRGYEVTGRLGRGGMGTVWRATQHSTRRPVALKLMGPGLFASEQARRRFDREVELTAKLEHPHIARVYESGLDRGIYFYAMELVDGQPLDSHCAGRKLSRRQVLELMLQVCEAVQHAHQRGVIHRDLKPSNVLVTADGRPKVVDFGLAKALSENGDGVPAVAVTSDGQISGTPLYMSPEQAAAKPVDTRSDVYSLGVILYELLTGRSPHGEKCSDTMMMRRVELEDVIRPRAADRTIDRDLDALLLKALAREPDARYASAAELAADIRRYLAGDPLTAKRPTLTYFARKRLRKHWLPATIALVVVSLLLAQAVWAYWRIREQRQIAVSRQLAALGLVELMKHNLDLAALLGVEAMRAAETEEAAGLLSTCIDHAPHLNRFVYHGHGVLAAAFSSDGRILASAGGEGTIRLWDLSANRPLGPPLRGHVGPVHSLAFSHNGKWLASGGVGAVDALDFCTEGEIRLWDMSGLRPGAAAGGGGTVASRKTWTAHNTEVCALAFSGDDTLLASGGGGQARLPGPTNYSIEIWTVATGGRHRGPLVAPAAPYDRRGVTALLFHPDRKHLVSGSEDGLVLVWDLKSYTVAHVRGGVGRDLIAPLPRTASASVPEREASVEALSFSEDGQQLWLASGAGNVLTLGWSDEGHVDPEPLAEPFKSPHRSVGAAAFTVDGARWATAPRQEGMNADAFARGQIALGDIELADGRPVRATAAMIARAQELAGRELPEEELSRLRSGLKSVPVEWPPEHTRRTGSP